MEGKFDLLVIFNFDVPFTIKIFGVVIRKVFRNEYT